MMQRECMDSDERIKGLRKLVEAEERNTV